MAAVTICSDFRAQEEEILHQVCVCESLSRVRLFHDFQIYTLRHYQFSNLQAHPFFTSIENILSKAILLTLGPLQLPFISCWMAP